MTVDENPDLSRRATNDAQAEYEAARVLVEDAWLPTDVLWHEAERDPTWGPRYATQNAGALSPSHVAPQSRAVDIYEGYDSREPFID